MRQTQFDELFKASEPGAIPTGEAEGIAIVTPGAIYSPAIATFVNNFARRGQVFDSGKGFLRNKILPLGRNTIIARVY